MLPLNTSYDWPDQDLPLSKISLKKVGIIESTNTISLAEKLELLLILTGKKWITEIKYKESPEPILMLLRALELPGEKQNYSHSKKGLVKWVQTASNQNILDYVSSRRNTLTILEAGTLYGYPTSHILGFMRLATPHIHRPRSAAEHYLAGVYSHDLHNQEKQYFESLWEELRKISPLLVSQAEEKYRSTKQSVSRE